MEAFWLQVTLLKRRFPGFSIEGGTFGLSCPLQDQTGFSHSQMDLCIPLQDIFGCNLMRMLIRHGGDQDWRLIHVCFDQGGSGQSKVQKQSPTLFRVESWNSSSLSWLNQQLSSNEVIIILVIDLEHFTTSFVENFIFFKKERRTTFSIYGHLEFKRE